MEPTHDFPEAQDKQAISTLQRMLTRTEEPSGQGTAGRRPLLKHVHSQVGLGVAGRHKAAPEKDNKGRAKNGVRASHVSASPLLFSLFGFKNSNGPDAWEVLSRICGFQKLVGALIHLGSDAWIFLGWGH